ncbi:hypothetical protein SAMN04515671_0913 [Nakamurella panacisegetis]|uniref:Uncharacterized protein n=1 Tax=Nakamurella panacisegetis TaxID=1090615 RepID=A0A1H0JH99_9ACTN|nr:hypothetical protein [Nakamurella panacisegetis]SDO43086.1 hypothetical protein SAMN04515671_0913 [Nakamurella panacisegetis]
MDVPSRIHFYSAVTGVSFELPPGFEAGAQDERSAQYEWRDEDDDQVLARVVVQQMDVGAAAVRTVAEAFAAADGDLVEERLAVIDDCPTATVVVHLPHGVRGSTPVTGPGGDDLVAHFTAVEFSGAVRTVAAFAPWADRDRWIPVFDEAVASCRFL